MRRREPATSSYDKIAKHLLGCPDTQEVLRMIERGLHGARVVKYTFQIEKEHNKPVRATPRFHIDIGFDTVVHAMALDGTRLQGLSCHEFTRTKDMERIIADNFDTKRCRTYNCKKENVLYGSDNSRGGFNGAFSEKVEDLMTSEVLLPVNTRLTEQALNMIASEEFAAARFEFLRQHAVKDIIAVMAMYDCLGKEVLSEALDQFVMHQIMEEEPDRE